eukprot:7826687-Heterocapsa_arctica.AAC.1
MGIPGAGGLQQDGLCRLFSVSPEGNWAPLTALASCLVPTVPICRGFHRVPGQNAVMGFPAGWLLPPLGRGWSGPTTRGWRGWSK